jgi:prepilin-type processing-associated H-X9-DG protein
MAPKGTRPLAACVALAIASLAGCGDGARVVIQDTRYPQCVQNLLKIGLALHTHHDEVGSFPKAAISDSQGRPGLSWRVAILPFLGERELYARFKLDEPWDSAHNQPLQSQMPAVYTCPGAPRGEPGFTHYRAFTGHGAFLEPAYDKRLEKVWWVGDDGTKHYAGEPRSGLTIAAFTDGTSNTLMVVEARQSVAWTKPDEMPFDPTQPSDPLFGAGSSHSGGFNVVFADASVWFLPNTISPGLFRALITRAGDEVVSLDRAATFQGGREPPRRPTVDDRLKDSGPVIRK